MTIELQPNVTDSDCILEATTDVPRQKLTPCHIDNLRINSENGLTKLESSSFYFSHNEKNLYDLGTFMYQITKLGIVIQVKICYNLVKYNVGVL